MVNTESFKRLTPFAVGEQYAFSILRKIEEKAPCFSAGMNPTIGDANHEFYSI